MFIRAALNYLSDDANVDWMHWLDLHDQGYRHAATLGTNSRQWLPCSAMAGCGLL
jgi:hypothetical protein